MTRNTKIKKHFYVAKGENDAYPWMFYGEEPPIIAEDGKCTSGGNNCHLMGGFCFNPIADSIKDNEVIKVYIRKETKKNKQL